MITQSQKDRPVALVRLTQDEVNKLDEFGEKIGMKRSKIFRKIVREIINNEPDLTPKEMAEFKNAVKQLAGMSRNLNQITRAVNAGKLPKRVSDEAFYKELTDEVRHLRGKLDMYIDASTNRWTGLFEE